MSESIILVDENNTIIGHKPKDEIDYDHDIYRTSGLWITNSSGDILLAQRSLQKTFDPGVRGPAVSGTNAEGETYRTNIIKEMEEELGLRDIPIAEGERVFIDDGHHYWGQWFTAVVDLPIEAFVLQEEEVAQVKRFSRDQVKALFAAQPELFIPSFKDLVPFFLT